MLWETSGYTRWDYVYDGDRLVEALVTNGSSVTDRVEYLYGDDGLLYGLDDYDVNDVLRSTSRYAYDEHDRVIRQDVDDDADGTLDEVWTQTWWGVLLVADVAEWQGEVVLTRSYSYDTERRENLHLCPGRRGEPLGLDHELGMPLTGRAAPSAMVQNGHAGSARFGACPTGVAYRCVRRTA